MWLAAMMLLAPGMFWTMMVGLPGMCLGRWRARRRAIRSYPPPGLSPTTIVIVFPWYDGACASRSGTAISATAKMATSVSVHARFILSPFVLEAPHGAGFHLSGGLPPI